MNTYDTTSQTTKGSTVLSLTITFYLQISTRTTEPYVDARSRLCATKANSFPPLYFLVACVQPTNNDDQLFVRAVAAASISTATTVDATRIRHEDICLHSVSNRRQY